MLDMRKNIWDCLGLGIVAITTNGSITKGGLAVPGRGVARQAAELFPDLMEQLGELIALKGNHVHPLSHGLVSFPVEDSAWSLPDPRLISRSAMELRQLADRMDWQQIFVPRPGCGGGGLNWQDVRPLLVEHFDERFIVIAAPEPQF